MITKNIWRFKHNKWITAGSFILYTSLKWSVIGEPLSAIADARMRLFPYFLFIYFSFLLSDQSSLWTISIFDTVLQPYRKRAHHQSLDLSMTLMSEISFLKFKHVKCFNISLFCALTDGNLYTSLRTKFKSAFFFA